MNTGQMLMATGAMVLLGTTVLTVNRNSLNQGTILRQTEVGIYAVSLATSYIQKAMSLNFDERTVVRPNMSVNPAPATYLGTAMGVDIPHYADHSAAAAEVANKDSTFDDFDDYNNYSKDTTITSVDRFHVNAWVYYVTLTPPYTKTAAPTWLKRIDVCVNNSISRQVFEKTATNKGTDTIKISYIKSYY
jgi:hypothetical protein